jgi:hypothetical protein
MSLTRKGVDYRRTQTGESVGRATTFRRRGCCGETPISLLEAVTVDCVTHLVCAACAVDMKARSAHAGTSVDVQSFRVWAEA